MNSTEAMMFPEEIWEEIFKKIDDVSDLVKLQPVCSTFNKLIRRLLDRDIRWKKRCRGLTDECDYKIFEKVCPDLVHRVGLAWRDEIDNFEWRKIYTSWKKWNSCLNREAFIDSVNNFPSFSKNEVITCTDVWDDIVGVATNEGLIYFCKIYEPDTIIYRADHKDEVRQIKFWYTGSDLLVVTRSIYEKIKFWNVFKKKEINTNNCFNGKILSISLNCCYFTYNNYLICTKYCDMNKVIILDSVLSTLLNPHEEIIASYSSEESIIVITKDQLVIGRHNINATNNNYEVDDICICLDKNLANTVVQKFYALSTNVMIGLCDQLLAVSVDNESWIVYNAFKHFFSIVTAITYHSNVLILGFDSGYICLLHIKNLSDLKSLDFATQPFKKIKVDRQPIVSLNVTDFQGEQFIIVTSEKNIHVIRFFKPIYKQI